MNEEAIKEIPQLMLSDKCSHPNGNGEEENSRKVKK